MFVPVQGNRNIFARLGLPRITATGWPSLTCRLRHPVAKKEGVHRHCFHGTGRSSHKAEITPAVPSGRSPHRWVPHKLARANWDHRYNHRRFVDPRHSHTLPSEKLSGRSSRRSFRRPRDGSVHCTRLTLRLLLSLDVGYHIDERPEVPFQRHVTRVSEVYAP